jgi:hypothetical protein
VKAVVIRRFGGPEVLEVKDIPEPAPMDGAAEACRSLLERKNFGKVILRIA